MIKLGLPQESKVDLAFENQCKSPYWQTEKEKIMNIKLI